MKTSIITTLVLIFSASVAFSQISIQCPADVTVAFFDLDQDHETYGDPIVNSPTSYTLTSNITVVNNTCDNQITTINYEVTEDTTTSTASCNQVITVTPNTLDDIIWPEASFELAAGSIDDLNPDLNLVERPEPYELLNGASQIFITYEDQVVQASPTLPYKLIRTWTALDWCSTDVISFTQVLKINQVSGVNLGVLEIETCFGGTTSAQGFLVSTNQTGFTLNTDNCELANNDITAYLNCVADENAIDANSTIDLEIVGSGDPLNGVSTLDMVIAQKHILGIDQLDSECSEVAGDVSGDGRLSALDLVVMRKLILGIYTAFPSSPSWVFVNGGDIQKGLSFAKSEFPLQNLNIIAVKRGDLNGSAIN